MQTSGQSKHAGRRTRRLNRVVFGGLLLVTGTALSVLLTLGGQSGQQADTRPRVFVEPGPSDFIDEALLRSEVDSFSESFPNFCSRVVVTADRGKATYVIRLSVDAMLRMPLTRLLLTDWRSLTRLETKSLATP